MFNGNGMEKEQTAKRDALTQADLANVEESLKGGLELAAWWRKAEAENSLEKIHLITVPNRDETGYSFFDEATFQGGCLPVMGDVPNVFFDQPKFPARPSNIDPMLWDQGIKGASKQWFNELREFSLKYFMRVADFNSPRAKPNQTGSPAFPLFSLCFKGFEQRKGFNFQQLYYKKWGDDRIQAFPESEQSAMIDVRRLEKEFEWVVAAVDIFDFAFTFPQNPDLPFLGLPLQTVAYVILHRGFHKLDEKPMDGYARKYSFGYAMLKRAEPGFLAYGPGEFKAGFQIYEFNVKANGEIRARMPFIVNRPEKILNIPLNPALWAFQLGESFSPEPFKSVFSNFKKMAGMFPTPDIDPVFLSIKLANLFTLGQAGRAYCITTQQLEYILLKQHFDQYYTMITGAQLTWRLVNNWTDAASLPEWAQSGV